jgi:hypothetical protein
MNAVRWWSAGLGMVAHVVMVGVTYIQLGAIENPRVRKLVIEDFERGWLEATGWCGMWVSWPALMAADLAWQWPAYAVMTGMGMAWNGGKYCAEELVSPRGHLLTSLFVPLVWMGVGPMVGRRWRWLVCAIGLSMVDGFGWLGFGW